VTVGVDSLSERKCRFCPHKRALHTVKNTNTNWVGCSRCACKRFEEGDEDD
jgi:hypothetical protein